MPKVFATRANAFSIDALRRSGAQRLEHDAHEEAPVVDVAELRRLDDVAVGLREERPDRAHDAGAIGARKREDERGGGMDVALMRDSWQGCGIDGERGELREVEAGPEPRAVGKRARAAVRIGDRAIAQVEKGRALPVLELEERTGIEHGGDVHARQMRDRPGRVVRRAQDAAASRLVADAQHLGESARVLHVGHDRVVRARVEEREKARERRHRFAAREPHAARVRLRAQALQHSERFGRFGQRTFEPEGDAQALAAPAPRLPSARRGANGSRP
jgi:hypothetical protein